MQKFWTLGLIALMVFGCATTKNLESAVGTWDFILKGTPNGDITGYFTIVKDIDKYTGVIYSNEGSNQLNNISIDNERLECNFNYQGYKVVMEGDFDGRSLDGKMTVDYNDFPLTATKRD